MQHVPIFGVGTGVEGDVKTAAQFRTFGECHRRNVVGIIRRYVNLAVRVGFVMVDVVLRQAIEVFNVCNCNFLLIVGDVAVKHGLLFRQLVVQLLQLIASGLVFIHTCQAELEQLALHVILGGAVGMRDIESGQGFINVTVEGERRQP